MARFVASRRDDGVPLWWKGWGLCASFGARLRFQMLRWILLARCRCGGELGECGGLGLVMRLTSQGCSLKPGWEGARAFASWAGFALLLHIIVQSHTYLPFLVMPPTSSQSPTDDATTSIALTNAPAVAAWRMPTNDIVYLGQKGTARIGLDIRLSARTALIDLRVPIGFQNSTAYTTLHLVIPPSRISHLSSTNTIPTAVKETFLHGRTCTSDHDILGLAFVLSTAGDLVAPAAGLGVPRSRKADEMLTLVKALGTAREFEIYVPRASLAEAQARALCEVVCGGRVVDDGLVLERLYGGAGGAVVPLEDPDQVVSGNAPLPPPAYEDVATGTEGESSRPGKRRRLNDADDGQGSVDEKTTESLDEKPGSSSGTMDINALAAVVLSLQARVKQLEGERATAPTPAVVRSTRTTGTQTEPNPNPDVDALEALATNTTAHIAQLRHDISTQAAAYATALRDLTAHLEGSVADMQYQCGQEADAGLDRLDSEWQERLTGIQLEMQDFVTQEMEEVEGRIKRDFEAGRAVLRVEWDE
ncbi:uncharacterized protein K452DRAFT_140897 [Aplosporella prunicola CBS 121167]|uniref:Uncharacterized protein n=1 Tax=Aplosporella prunicola CBS 121167 TaxID=1176127 RepID=A0A6A6BNE6_9PEZI|nr:uncharacterized protein K452DRAFT_140897 [Aplosporella prunicola CBS 121167]KAF2144357.1 hypothetical protein K452DRAFT_140897 [Aplosporella prunicola CBS 121167]